MVLVLLCLRMRMIRYIISLIVLLTLCKDLSAQYSEQEREVVKNDTLSMGFVADTSEKYPRPIPNLLPPDLFIPSKYLQGLTRWMAAPMTRPTVHVIPVYGFSGYSFGKFTVDHWDRFFSNLLSYNEINVEPLIDSQHMMLGNIISLGKKRRLFFNSGILYGRDFGVWGNMLGMGSREGLIYRPNGYLMITLWSQEYQSVYAYSPVLYARPGESTAAVKLPASPVMVSYGAQAYFLAGQFWIGFGATFWKASEPEH